MSKKGKISAQICVAVVIVCLFVALYIDISLLYRLAQAAVGTFILVCIGVFVACMVLPFGDK